MNDSDRKAVLRQRTKTFARQTIRFFIALDRRSEAVRVLGKQLLRAGTSVGANYREASRARSSVEFVAKIELCAQEADETQYWLELLQEECAVDASLIDPIWQEANELIGIFVTMALNTKHNRNRKEAR